MVFVKGGTFKMGSNEYDREKPIHDVTLDDFYMGKYEVTNKQFAEFLNDYGSDKIKTSEFAGKEMIKESAGSENWGLTKSGSFWKPASTYENHPVIYVSWYGATEYAKWLSKKTGKNYRLPTEAEWEYAAGASTSSATRFKYAGTNSEGSLGTYAFYNSNSGAKTHNVGTKRANALGIYDMSGNVYEWCSDWHGSSYYSNSPSRNPRGPSSGSDRVYRGGAWARTAVYCRVASRHGSIPTICYYFVGFRLARRR